MPALRDRAGIVAALVGGGAAVLAARLPLKLGLVAAILIGVAAGMAIERRTTVPASALPDPATLPEDIPL